MHQTDEELVTLAVDGDTDAFNELVVRWERPIYGLAYRVLGREEDARDVCQEAFLRAFRSIKGFKGQAKFSSWLYRIALNLCRDWLRKERRVGFVQPLEDVELQTSRSVDPISETVEDLIVRRDLGRAVSKVMATLSEEQRTAIVLKEYHGLTFQEIADLLECPLSTVKTRLYQGLSVLRRQLEQHGLTAASMTERTTSGVPVAGRAGAVAKMEHEPVCQQQEALVAYLYDESEPAERAAFEAHLEMCARCVTELESLRRVRGTLETWVPPELNLGVRIVARSPGGAGRMVAPGVPAVVGTSGGGGSRAAGGRGRGERGDPVRGRWLRVPDGVGRSGDGVGRCAGGRRDTGDRPRSTTPCDPSRGRSSPPSATNCDVSCARVGRRPDRLPARFPSCPPSGTELAVRGQPGRTLPAGVQWNDAEMFQRFQALVTQSEQRQRQELALWLTELTREYDMQRLADQRRVHQQLGAIEDGFNEFLVRTSER